MKQTIACLLTATLTLAGFLLLTACTEAEAEVTTEPTPVEYNEVTEPEVIEEVYWLLTDEERDLVERVVAAEARGESIEDACEVHGTDADELVEKINEYLANK